jgi:hypothetical protein
MQLRCKSRVPSDEWSEPLIVCVCVCAGQFYPRYKVRSHVTKAWRYQHRPRRQSKKQYSRCQDSNTEVTYKQLLAGHLSQGNMGDQGAWSSDQARD